MDSFEKRQILMQVIEYLEDYYLMHPDKKGELPDWSEIDRKGFGRFHLLRWNSKKPKSNF